GLRVGLARSAWMRNGGCDLLVVALLTGVSVYLGWEATLGHARYTPAYQVLDFVSGAAWAALLLLLLLAPLRLKTILVNPLLVHVGVLSYSIYLTHAALISHSIHLVRQTLGVQILRWEPAGVALL